MRTPLLLCILGAALFLTLPGAAQTDIPSATPAPTPVEKLLRQNPGLKEHGYLPTAEVEARHEYEQERGIHFPELVRGSVTDRSVAVTFDDGPHLKYTPQILRILARENVRATFFVVGKEVDINPQLVQEEAAQGHEVANHTYHHLRLAAIPPDLIEPELRDGARAIERAIGSPTRLYRPPGGEYNARVIETTKRLGLVMVLWTDDPGDFAQPGGPRIEERVMQDVSNGSIILLHDGIQQTIDVLPDLIHRLRERGFSFVTCSQMALEKGILKSGGPTVGPSPVLPVPAPPPEVHCLLCDPGHFKVPPGGISYLYTFRGVTAMANDLVPLGTPRPPVLYADPQGNIGQLREQPKPGPSYEYGQPPPPQTDSRAPHHDTPVTYTPFQKGVEKTSKVSNFIMGGSLGVVGAKIALAAGGVILGSTSAPAVVGIFLALGTGYVAGKLAVKAGNHIANWAAERAEAKGHDPAKAATWARGLSSVALSGAAAWPVPLYAAVAEVGGGLLSKTWHFLKGS